MARITLLAFVLTLLLAGCMNGSDQEESMTSTGARTTTRVSGLQGQAAEEPCPVTPANGRNPPGEASTGSRYLGNGSLFTDLYASPIRPRPEDVNEDGLIVLKVPWWRGVSGDLEIEGQRLDAAAPPLTAWIPDGYGRRGFQSTAITFPTAGCWQVTGTVAGRRLTFVVLLLEPDATEL